MSHKMFRVKQSVNITLWHGFKICTLLTIIQVVKITCGQLVFFLPVYFRLEPCAHYVALHSWTVGMKKLGFILHCFHVCNVLRMFHWVDVSAIYVCLGNFRLWWWFKASPTIHSKRYLAFQRILQETVTEKKWNLGTRYGF